MFDQNYYCECAQVLVNEVELMPSSSSSNSSRPQSRSGSPARSEAGRQQNTGFSASGVSGDASTDMNSNSVHDNHYVAQIFVHALIISTLLCIFPLVPRSSANVAYRISLLCSASSSLYFMHSFHGIPKEWSLTAIQEWFTSVIAGKDFSSFAYCLLFILFSANFKFALLPLLCREVEHIAISVRYKSALNPSSFYSYMPNRNLLGRICLWLETKSSLNNFSSNAEIALGFLLILSLFSWQRSMILTFLYWQLLKYMYRSPATAGYHQGAWARIGKITNPFINCYTPFLNTPLSAIKRWWLR